MGPLSAGHVTIFQVICVIVLLVRQRLMISKTHLVPGRSAPDPSPSPLLGTPGSGPALCAIIVMLNMVTSLVWTILSLLGCYYSPTYI